MTVGDLQVELAKFDSQLNAMVLMNGSFAPVLGVTAVAGAEFMVIRGKGTAHQSKRFSVGEQGLIGHLARFGFSDEKIAEVLGRSPKSVAAKRKVLGY